MTQELELRSDMHRDTHICIDECMYMYIYIYMRTDL